MIKKIQGEKIFLSPIEKEEISYFHQFINDMEMSVLTGTFSMVVNREKEAEYFQDLEDTVQLGIHEMETGKIIGLVEFMNISSIGRSAEIGISIGESEERNQGFGREALELMLEFGFRTLNFHSIYLTVVDGNARGMHLYESIGFKEAGRLREHRFVNGIYRDVLYMDLLREEFKGRAISDEIERIIQ